MIVDTTIIGTFGFPIAVCIYLFWERHHVANSVRKERTETLHYLENAIKNDLVHAIDSLKTEIIKLNERCNGGKEL